MDDISFVATGFVTARQKGPLTITLVRNDDLVVVEVAFGSAGVFAQLTAGAAVDEVLRKLSSFQKVETQIPPCWSAFDRLDRGRKWNDV